MTTANIHRRGRDRLATLLRTAAGTDRFRTWIAAASATGLAALLEQPGPHTIFVPSDRAFDRLPRVEANALFRNQPRLRDLLLAHMVAGLYPARELIPSARVATRGGPVLRFSQRDGDHFVNDVLILTPDILAENGVIHEIDRVMLPYPSPGALPGHQGTDAA